MQSLIVSFLTKDPIYFSTLFKSEVQDLRSDITYLLKIIKYVLLITPKQNFSMQVRIVV